MMSFVSILLVASAFYVVHGRPGPAMVHDLTTQLADPDEIKTPENDFMSMTDAGEYQHQVNSILGDMVTTIEKNLLPLISQLEENTQEELITMALNGFTSYLDYVIYLIEEREKLIDATNNIPDEQEYEDMSQEFDELDPELSGLIITTPVPEDDETVKHETLADYQTEEVPNVESSATTEPDMRTELRESQEHYY